MAANDFLSKSQHASKRRKRQALRASGGPSVPLGVRQYGYGSPSGWWGEDTWGGDRDNDDEGGEGGGGDGGGGE